MSKKLNNKSLLIILAALGGVYLLSTLLGSKDTNSNFKSELLSIDTSAVTSILVYPKNDGLAEIKFTKNGNSWTVQKGAQSGNADPNAPTAMLGTLAKIKTQSRVAISKNKWTDYEVTDSLGTRVKAMAGDKVLADVMMGKFSFKQQPQSMTSYLRLYNETDVYSVDGPIAMAFNRNFDAFRDKTFISLNKANITKVSINENGKSASASLGADNAWIGADPTAMDGYLTKIANLRGNTIKEGFSPSQAISTVTIEGNNMAATTVSCYADGEGYVLNSSQNPSVFFQSDSEGIYKMLVGDFLAIAK